MKRTGIEISVGCFMLIGIIALLFLAIKVSGLSGSFSEGYEVKVRFENIGNLTPKAPISMSGVKIGRVKSIEYDQENFQALVILEIEKTYNNIPSDSIANIYTAGLLGEKYIGIEAGGAEENLQDGDELEETGQSAIVLEKLIGKFLVNQTSE